jgi:signal transduction histidine kinase
VRASLPDDEAAWPAALHDTLGLAIARSIIDAHHGSVHVESEPGIGTTVRMSLPRACPKP